MTEAVNTSSETDARALVLAIVREVRVQSGLADPLSPIETALIENITARIQAYYRQRAMREVDICLALAKLIQSQPELAAALAATNTELAA